MSRSALVYVENRPAGRLEEGADGYVFTYDREYLLDPAAPPVSLTLLKRSESYYSPVLFPFFYGLLAEGALKTEQCRRLKLDEADHFGRLIKTTGENAIGAVSVIEEGA